VVIMNPVKERFENTWECVQGGDPGDSKVPFPAPLGFSD
jgi:hypothetical protein